MSATRLRWQGTQRRQRLFDKLCDELAVWLGHWSVDPAFLSLSPLEDATWPEVSGWQWRQSGGLRVGAGSADLDRLGALLARASASDALQLGRRVGHRAWNALLAQLAIAGKNELSWTDAQAPSAREREARWGGTAWQLSGVGFTAVLWIDAELCERWLPSTVNATSRVHARDSALGGEPLSLQVVLDLGNATLADTQALRIGDVLVSNAPLDRAFQLRGAHARPLAAGRLHRNGERRSIQLDATS
ncbi:hypothetical protein [Arenimonas sp.]|uniref:hypothetical protein n=1 Tax=Arenimonas sp. TaxID=1872635 RepID=UPI0039E428B9